VDIYKPKVKICVSGAAETGHCAPKTLEVTMELGRQIANHDAITVTGATTGTPYWAAKGAKEEGGVVVGLSPAYSESEHIKKYKLPVDYHDLVIYTGFGYSGRNLLLTRSSDAVIIVCGRIGTLNEFTIAFEDNKVIGILEGTGGTADEVRGIIAKGHRGPGKIVFNSDPKALVEEVLELLKTEKTESAPL
jgi:uncharacterized protein (TIGR00725 family)